MLKYRFLTIGLLALATLMPAASHAQFELEDSRSFVARQLCYGLFSEQHQQQCTAYLYEGDFLLNDPVEFQVLRNLMVVANTNFVGGDFLIEGDYEETLRLFSAVEGRRFSEEILSACTMSILRFRGEAIAFNSHQYLGCVLRNSEPDPHF